VTGAALVALAAAILWHIQGYPEMPGQRFGPAWFPGLIAAGLGGCGILLIVGGVRQPGAWLTVPEWVGRSRPLFGVASVIAGLVLYVLAADKLGFHIVGVALLTLWIRVLGGSWRAAMIVAVIATVVIHLSFYKLLRIPLPWGLLERYAF
jgi:putative tricarboxylic transport membrane protein